MRTLKILQISTTDRDGGAEGSAWNLLRAYRDRGHKSWLAVGWKRSDDPNVFEIPHLRPTVPWARLCWVLHGRLALWEGSLRGVWRLRYWLRTLASGWAEIDRRLGREDFNHPGTWKLLDLTPERPDIVHAHNLHGGYFDLRFLVSLSHQVPVVLNLRDMWLLTGHCAYPVGCERWETGCGNCPDLSIYPAIERDATAHNWKRKRRIYRKSRLYIATPSEWLMDQVRVSMLSGVQYRVVPNAIDLDVFRPIDRGAARRYLGLPQDASIVMLTAQTPFKDYATMEAALGRLVKPSDKDLLFICLGTEGTEKDVGYGQMIYPGFERDPQRMAHYYAASDVFVHAAKDEAFGKTIVEAMACGTPVVATAVGGISEIVENGKNGFLVPARDSGAMSVAVERLLSDTALHREISTTASEHAARHFGLDRQVDNFLSWYGEVIEDWRRNQAHALSNPD